MVHRVRRYVIWCDSKFSALMLMTDKQGDKGGTGELGAKGQKGEKVLCFVFVY
jgi:hypothetical protein